MKGQSSVWTQFTSTNSGLPFNSVRCIAFDPDSNTWIGTDFGLARLSPNGSWTVFGTWNSPLTGNDIRSLAIAEDGTKWIGTFANGLFGYRDTAWLNYNTTNSPLSDDFVRSLAVDTAGVIWIGTVGGLNRLDTAGNWSLYTMWNSPLGSNNIACLYLDSSTNDKWAGTVNGGLLHIRQDTVLTSFTIQNSGISDNTVVGIDMDAFGNLFLASPANGMIVKLSNFGWITSNTVSSNIPTAGLTCLELNTNDEPWIGSIDHGLLHRSAGSFSFYDSSNSPLNDPTVQCLKINPSGHIWIGTQSGGLFVFDPNLSTGMMDETEEIRWGIYPNPARESLQILTPYHALLKIEVLSLDGRVLKVERQRDQTVDLSGLSAGTYLIRVFFENRKSSTRMFVKE